MGVSLRTRRMCPDVVGRCSAAPLPAPVSPLSLRRSTEVTLATLTTHSPRGGSLGWGEVPRPLVLPDDVPAADRPLLPPLLSVCTPAASAATAARAGVEDGVEGRGPRWELFEAAVLLSRSRGDRIVLDADAACRGCSVLGR